MLESEALIITPPWATEPVSEDTVQSLVSATPNPRLPSRPQKTVTAPWLVLITHAGCIAAGVGRAFSRVCLFVCLFVRAVKGKRLELSTPNLVHEYSIAVARHALTQRSKGQGHTVTKTVTVARLLVTRAATAVAGVGLHVNTSIRLPTFSTFPCCWGYETELARLATNHDGI